MPFESHPSIGLRRYSSSLALATVSMLSLAIFTVVGASGRAIAQFKNSGGTVVATVGSGGVLDVKGITINGKVFGTGSNINLTVADSMYVNTQGDTMTGALRINLTSGFIGLNVLQTASGNVIHAEKNLTSSGGLVVKTDALVKGAITVIGSMSGNTLTLSALGAAPDGSSFCKKSGGAVGYREVSATGTLLPTCN